MSGMAHGRGLSTAAGLGCSISLKGNASLTIAPCPGTGPGFEPTRGGDLCTERDGRPEGKRHRIWIGDCSVDKRNWRPGDDPLRPRVIGQLGYRGQLDAGYVHVEQVLTNQQFADAVSLKS